MGPPLASVYPEVFRRLACSWEYALFKMIKKMGSQFWIPYLRPIFRQLSWIGCVIDKPRNVCSGICEGVAK